ncbi:hypothetical protein L211DRAFT_859883 [Terfezia boudieri ATCC MYA-4762]|uniref:Rad21/Rec8-like protein N-terminal domain-containing protein n=1 Tax=Terfezia boudieri ATCC MYA-4762 TaxID=1051890 RepID=A0A3N4M203_9PEZI|nr:hypothetical protein L211DRAFT_859883 [Terfezia boudieri ATCC MYA-4762]
MFYSETLLSKTGPLARVWLSANLERKLSKTHILQSNVCGPGPMALRIYSRKARYLYEDCNEALMKIKMAFRPGIVDLPTGTTAHSAAQLTLPDVITELDLLMPDPSSLLADLDIGEPLQVEDKRLLRVKERNLLEEDDDISIEMGRDRPPSRAMSEDFTREDFQLDITMIGATPKARPQDKSELPLQLDEDLNLGGDNDFGANQSLDWQASIGEEISTILGSHESSVERELEVEIRPKGTGVLDMTFVDDAREGSKEPEEVVVAAKPSAPRKRFLVEDTVTEIKAKQIKAQQEDRSSILKEPSFLPRDAGVFALVTMQRTGGFASSVFYPKNIHPDLAGLLSPEFVKRMAAAKRKREEEQAAEGEDGIGKGSPAKHSRRTSPKIRIRQSAALNREQCKFQDLLPPATTSRADATKIFFEVLVLATKDIVKVKQEKGFGRDIFIAPKKGLWGKWAEEKDEQQIAEEEQTRKEAEESRVAEEQKKRRPADIPIRSARVEV